jgi:hypothetical protein
MCVEDVRGIKCEEIKKQEIDIKKPLQLHNFKTEFLEEIQPN